MSKPTPVAWARNTRMGRILTAEGFHPDAEPLYPSSALQALEEENEMLRQHVEELQQKNAAETCACSYDGPGTVCDGHSPKLAAAEARLEEALKIKIKPLVWVDKSSEEYFLRLECRTPIGTSYIAKAVRPGDMLICNGRYYVNVDQMKKAVEEDYQSKILSAIEE